MSAKNIIFDFGCVLLHWDPLRVYTPYFGSEEKARWFIDNVCTMAWNSEMDAGKPFAQGIAEKIAQFPEWEKEIRMFKEQWIGMVGDEEPGMYDLELELRSRGWKLWGLTNWSRETFNLVKDSRVFTVLDGYLVSADVHLLKPSPEIFCCLLEKFGLEPSDCIFVDDNAANVAGAEAVGIRSHLFTGVEELREWLAAIDPLNP